MLSIAESLFICIVRYNTFFTKTAKKVGIFFVLTFVGVLGTPEGENGKSKKGQGTLDGCLVLSY